MKRIFGEINVTWQTILKSYELETFIIKDDKKRGEKKEKGPERDNLDGDPVLVYNRKDLEKVIRDLICQKFLKMLFNV